MRYGGVFVLISDASGPTTAPRRAVFGGTGGGVAHAGAERRPRGQDPAGFPGEDREGGACTGACARA
eukprot:2638274-Pyramimonas_sp.AAC.1